MLIRNIQGQHHSWNVKSTCNWHDIELQMHGFLQKEKCASLPIIHCDVTWYTVRVYRRISLIFLITAVECQIDIIGKIYYNIRSHHIVYRFWIRTVWYHIFIYGIIPFGSKNGLSPCGSRHLQTKKFLNNNNNAIRMNMHRFQCSEKECLYT